MSPLLQRIESELAECANPIRRAELLAERACYLARTGDFAEAKRIVQVLRSDSNLSGNLSTSVWVMTIEGLVMYFEHVAREAYDRLLRAHALSRGGGIHQLSSLTAAWLAHIEFANSAYDRMQSHLREVCNRSDFSLSGQAQIRAGIILGAALLHANLRTIAQSWYEQARQIAVGAGDEAALGAIMYNRAAFNLSRLRIRQCIESEATSDTDAEIRFAQLEIDSADQFQRGTRNASLPHLLQICRAQAMQLRDDYKAAADLYFLVLSANVRTEDFADKTPLLIDLVECLFNLGQKQDALTYLARVSASDIRALDTDDQVICYSKLRRLRNKGLPLELVDDLDAILQSVRQKYEADQKFLSDSLSEFVAMDPTVVLPNPFARRS